jgi:predicted XRE-type DNA-binding protein
MARRREKVEAGSGDVFVDLGFRDAEERKLRVKLAMQINDLIAERKLSQARAADLFGISQPHVSELKNYKLGRFSSERLLRFLTRLDRDVEIIIRRKAKARSEGRLVVSVAP